jgi:ribosomal protein L44E
MNNTELITTVLLDDPLYKKRTTKGRILQDTIGSFKPINYQCNGKCQSVQTFALETVNKERPSEYQQDMRMMAAVTMSRGVSLKYVERNTTYNLEFVCLKCKSYRVYFTLLMDYEVSTKNQDDDSKGLTTVQKTGQYPPQESAIDKDVEKWLSKADKDLYRKGLRSEVNGFGIGAFGYFRRIVENNIEKLLDQVANTSDDAELIKAVNETKKQHNAEDRLNMVKDHAPGSYSHKEQNVFKILYSALSEGLHKETDEECLDSATSVRICLDFIIKRVRRATEEQKSLEASITKLTS